jgi:hypothetical protein
MQLCLVGGQQSRAAPGGCDPFTASFLTPSNRLAQYLVLFLANLLTRALAGERSFHAFLLTGLQVKGVAFDLFDDVFLLHFALEAAQGVLQRLTLLQSNFRQTDTPPDPSGRTE